jgi:hypothetical protein
MYVKWKLISLCLEIVLASTQDRCTVCAIHTIGLELIFGTPDGCTVTILCDVDQGKAHYDPFGDSVNLSARWVHSLRRM